MAARRTGRAGSPWGDARERRGAMRTKRCVAAACLGLVVFSLATGCDRLPGKPKAAARWMAPEQVTDFTQLYAQNCAGCHGVDGRLGAARPLHDPLYLALVGTDMLHPVIADGVPGTAMPAFAEPAGGNLTDRSEERRVGKECRSRWS